MGEGARGGKRGKRGFLIGPYHRVFRNDLIYVRDLSSYFRLHYESTRFMCSKGAGKSHFNGPDVKDKVDTIPLCTYITVLVLCIHTILILYFTV